MSTFVYASDLHGNREAYDRLFSLKADAVVLGGDLLPYPLKRGGNLLEIQKQFVEAYLAEKLAERPCYWIPGNDDWEAVLGPLKGTAIHRRAVPFLDGLSIAGYACVPVTPFGMKDFDRRDVDGWEPKEEPKRCLKSSASGIEEIPLSTVLSRPTIEAELARLAEDSDPSKTVYVMHTPPFATGLDRLHGIAAIGSRAVKRFIEVRRPPLTLHGHVHESPGIERVGKTVCANPGDSMHRLRALRVDLSDLSVTPV